MNIENFISDAVRRSVEALYGTLDGEQLQIQKTRKEFEGDYTLVTFPLLRRSRKSPEATATEIGGYMTANVPEIKSFNVIKGFLNLVLDGAFWAARFDEVAADAEGTELFVAEAGDLLGACAAQHVDHPHAGPLELLHLQHRLADQDGILGDCHFREKLQPLAIAQHRRHRLPVGQQAVGEQRQIDRPRHRHRQAKPSGHRRGYESICRLGRGTK